MRGTLRVIAAAVGTLAAIGAASAVVPPTRADDAGRFRVAVDGKSQETAGSETTEAGGPQKGEQLILVPLPAPVYIGAAGLIGVALVRKRVLRHR